jgi:glycosyltransferase involved in cell wall biosynthesis
MRIAFNIQPIVSGNKTGVAYSQDACIRMLINQHPQDEFVLEYFTYKNRKQKEKIAGEYCRENVTIKTCNVPGSWYRSCSTVLPLPYRWFFKGSADINHFYNYIIPPEVQDKSIVTIHDMAFKRYPETVRAKTKYMLKIGLQKSIQRAARIITVSEFSKKEILHYYDYPDNKITVVYNGVDRDKYNTNVDSSEIAAVCATYGIPQDYILYLGTLEPRKNLERLIKAYAILKHKHGDFPVLVIAGGNGWLFDTIFKTVWDLKIGESIVFTGYVNDREKTCLMAGAGFFCFPSLYEGFGMPVLEAMACGAPVLSSGNSSLAEIAGNAALLVDSSSVEHIASGLEKLYLDGTLRSDLRKKGLERIKDFSWNKSAEALYAVYKEAINE